MITRISKHSARSRSAAASRSISADVFSTSISLTGVNYEITLLSLIHTTPNFASPMQGTLATPQDRRTKGAMSPPPLPRLKATCPKCKTKLHFLRANLGELRLCHSCNTDVELVEDPGVYNVLWDIIGVALVLGLALFRINLGILAGLLGFVFILIRRRMQDRR